MKKKRGFTLVELLVTIVLLGVVATIIIFNVTNVSKNSKKTDYERFVASIKSSASVYADMNPETFQDLYQNKAFVYITVGELIDSGLTDEKLKNPYTDEYVKRDELVKVSLDTTTAALTFEYPIDKSKENKETFMVAINDYVVWGEPYDCMQGLGTYNLALSDEEGNLITNVNTLKSEYHLACSMPGDFEKTQDNKYFTTKAGTYDITYTWLTKSGIKKSFTRTLKVNAKVQPGFKTYYDDVETNYDFDDLENGKMWATPEYIAAENRWKYLTYKPYIEGADEETTVYNIKAQSKDPVGSEFYVVGSENNYVNDFKTRYDAYDGNVLYTVKTIIRGHYDKEYSYDAEGKYNIRQKLVIPKEYVEGTSTNWTLSKDFTVKNSVGAKNLEIYSKFGIDKFEYRLVPEDSTLGNDALNDSRYTFDKVKGSDTKKIIDVRNPSEECKKELRYMYVYMRAINKNGYIGDWVKLDGYLTNQVDLLVLTDSNSCTDCNKCCKDQSSGACYYCSGKKYVNINGYNFVIIERLKDGTLKAAYDGVSTKCVYGSQTSKGVWGIQTCDGYFRANYTVTRAVATNIIKAAAETIKGVDKSYLKTINFGGYSGNVGTLTTDDFYKYKNALLDSKRYWTVTAHYSTKKVYVDDPFAHGDSTTVSESYFYVVSGNTTTTAYYGACNYVKPLVNLNTIYTCSGDGTKENPYKIL